jgi:chaperone required for assembly of F1-ATPase
MLRRIPSGKSPFTLLGHRQSNDLLSFHEEEPQALVRLQDTHWKPLLAWAREELGVDLRVHDSILGASQPELSKERLKEIISSFDEWQLAGMCAHIVFGLEAE